MSILAQRPAPQPDRPAWSPRTILLLSTLYGASTAALVFLLGHKSVWVESYITLGITAAGLFLFLATGLYRGVTLAPDPPVDLRPRRENNRWLDSFQNWDISDFSVDLGEGCLPALLGIVLGIAVLLALVFIAPLLIEGIALLCLGIAWLFSRALRQVFHHSQRCHNNWSAALPCALFYTVMYTGWLFALIQLLYFFRR